MTTAVKLDIALAQMPPPGGNGCHPHLLRCANLAKLAGLEPEEAAARIRAAIPAGKRPVTDRELADAIRKAYRSDYTPTGRPRQPRRNWPAILAGIIQAGLGTTEEDFRRSSPIAVPTDQTAQAVLTLASLYREDEYLFLGDRYDRPVRKVRDWLEAIRSFGPAWPHIIPNPVSGREGETKDGRTSYRSDTCIAAFRFAVVEFDGLSPEHQLAFLAAVKMPIALIVFSGGRSYHAWVKVAIADATEWETRIERRLFAQMLQPLGVDAACKNEARLSRLPGHSRGGQIQRLIYLNPEGRSLEKKG